MCQCNENLVMQLEQEFKRTLQHQDVVGAARSFNTIESVEGWIVLV